MLKIFRAMKEKSLPVCAIYGKNAHLEATDLVSDIYTISNNKELLGNLLGNTNQSLFITHDEKAKLEDWFDLDDESMNKLKQNSQILIVPHANELDEIIKKSNYNYQYLWMMDFNFTPLTDEDVEIVTGIQKHGLGLEKILPAFLNIAGRIVARTPIKIIKELRDTNPDLTQTFVVTQNEKLQSSINEFANLVINCNELPKVEKGVL